jgi:hypothetical protein
MVLYQSCVFGADLKSNMAARVHKKKMFNGQDYLIKFLKGHIKLTFHQNCVPIELKRRFVCEFPIGFYVKPRSVVVAILVGECDCLTQFCLSETICSIRTKF